MSMRTAWNSVSSRLNFMQAHQLRWHLHAQAMPTVGVAGLPPELVSCLPKRVYALVASPSAALDALLMYSVKQLLERPLIWVSARSGEQMLNMLEQFGVALDDEQTQKHLTLFSLHALPQHSRHDISRLLLELERYRLGPGGVLLFEGGEYLFDWETPEAFKQEVRWLDDWAEQYWGRVVWVLSNGMGCEGRLAAVHRMQQSFGGIAQLISGRGELAWKMDLWETPDGVRLGETYPLRFTHEGQLAFLAPGEAQNLLLALDEQRMVALQGVVAGERWVPEHWEIVADVDELLSACDGAVAATVLIDFRSGYNIEPLLHAIYELRQQCGNKLKIVVREIDRPARYQYESLFLSVGANQVIGREVSFSRFLALVSAVQGQQLSRVPPADFDTAITSLLNAEVSGYLSPERFAAVVKGALERSRQTGIVCALVKLPLWPQVAHMEALNACRLVRNGDVCTADERHVYLFFFACQAPDIPGVLERVFAEPLDLLFEGEVLLVDAISIESFVRDFERRIVEAPLVDYSAVLTSKPRPEPQRVTGQPAPVAVAVAAVPRQPVPIGAPVFDADTHPPRSVTPCSLPLKGGAHD